MKKIALLLLLVAGQVEARWLTSQEAGSVLEKFSIEYDIHKDGSWVQTSDYVVRVQSEDAKVNASLFPIEYNAFTDQVEILEAYTLNGKRRLNVEPSAIEDRDKGEAKDYDVQKVRSVVFPQVQIGSRLFLKYRVKVSKPLIEGRWSTVLNIPPGYHVEKFYVAARSESPLFDYVRDPRKLVTVRRPNPNTVEIRNSASLPGWVHAEKDPIFHPGGNLDIVISTDKDWPRFFQTLGRDYDKIIAQEIPKDLKSWITAARKKKTTADKINFLQEKISHEFRYFGDWRRHDGGFVPRSLTEISNSRYGDCKDLSTLLTAMLRSMGLDAKVALVRRGPNPWGHEPDYALPAMNHFNHAIVHVQDGQNEYWLDPTNPVASLAPYPDISGRPAWLMGEVGRLARLPDPTPEQFEHVHEYEYRFDADDEVMVRVKADFKNLAPHAIANDLMLLPRTQVLSETLEYFSEGNEVKSHKYRLEPNTDRLLKDMKVDLEYEAGRLTFNAGPAAFWVIPDGFMQGAFYETEDRESDLRLSEEPYLFKVVRRLKDTKLAQERPEICQVRSTWMDLDRQVAVDRKDVVITQNISLKKPFITRAEFRSPAFKKLQEDTKRCFYRSGVLIEPLKKG